MKFIPITTVDKRDSITGVWSFMICASHVNIIGVILSRRMRWVSHVACVGERCIQGLGEGT
jgi:hypothetical protein